MDKVKQFAGAATGFVQGQMSSQPRGPPSQGSSRPSDYSSNLEAPVAAFMGDDDSDDDIGKPADI